MIFQSQTFDKMKEMRVYKLPTVSKKILRNLNSAFNTEKLSLLDIFLTNTKVQITIYIVQRCFVRTLVQTTFRNTFKYRRYLRFFQKGVIIQ